MRKFPSKKKLEFLMENPKENSLILRSLGWLLRSKGGLSKRLGNAQNEDKSIDSAKF